ncbi:MAG: hypothetical protein IPO81_20035 [Kouleothrix sp.]|nr:hypothetical protein [Kouleothrix sp.]
MQQTGAMSEFDPRAEDLPGDLLRTKLEPPRPPAPTMPRPALVARLDAGLARKLTLLAAPAGYGKTTLLAEWVAGLAHPAAWVTCDPGDNDPARFWTYVLSACRQWGGATGRAGLSALRAAQPPALDAVLTTLLNELALLAGPRVLVLDDFHTVVTPELLAQLASLIEHLPRSVQVVLSTRATPELPLARWRARNELTELGAGDLRFSPEEIQAFLDQALPIALAPATVARLAGQTEGWAAGLRLAVLAAPASGDAAAVEQALESFGGEHPHVVAYLAGEVLAAQPEPLQAFLLATSFLPRLSGPVCDAVMGRADSARLLDQLAGANLFLRPIGGVAGGWYRYHPLFAAAMRQRARQRTSGAEVRALHAAAGAWYEAHGMLADAVDAALAAEAWERAATLIEQVLERDTFGEAHAIRRWVAQLPEQAVQARPLVCFGYASALLFAGDRYDPANAHTVEAWARLAEAGWQPEGNAARLGQVAALRAMVAFWQDDLAAAFAYAGQASALLDAYDVRYQGICRLFHGMEALLGGEIADALSLAMEARTLCTISRNTAGALASTFVLASASFQQGNLDLAEALYQEWLAAAVGGAEMMDDQSEALYGLAAVAYERDELEAAEQHATRALALGQQRQSERLRAQASLILARIQQAHGHAGQAQQLAQALATRTRAPLLQREIQGWQADLALAAGDLEAAGRWRAALATGGTPAARLQQEHEALIVARLQIALGETAAAIEALEAWRAEAAAAGRTRGEIATLILQALAHAAQSEQPSAAQALARALALGQPRGMRRIFLDAGEPLAGLLRAVAPTLKRANAAYAGLLLRALAPGQATPRAPLLEPLSAQEQRVLRMLVAGRSNAEIAGELTVSPNTIKTHVKNIYRKLDVGSRDELRAAVRELGLLKSSQV